MVLYLTCFRCRRNQWLHRDGFVGNAGIPEVGSLNMGYFKLLSRNEYNVLIVLPIVGA